MRGTDQGCIKYTYTYIHTYGMGLEKSIIDAIDNTNLRMTDLGFSVSQMVHDAVIDDEDHDEDDGQLQPDHDDDEQYLESALQMGRRRRTGVRGRPKAVDYGFGKSTTHKMAPEAARLMGAANLAFVGRDYDKAAAVLLQVIQLAPNSFEPYHTLGLVYEERGERERAAGFYLLAALINPNNGELWQKLADWAQEDDRPGKREEAIFCLGKAIACLSDDTEGGNVLEDNYWRRARLFLANNHPKEAIKSFTKLLSARLDDIALVKRIAKLAISQEIPTIAAEVLERAARKNPDRLSWSYLNLMLELWFMSATPDDDKHIVAAVKEYCGRLIDQHVLLSNPEWGLWTDQERHCWLLTQVPVEIYLKYAIASVRSDDSNEDRLDLSRIRQCDPESYGDLITTLADALYARQMYSAALDCFTLLQSCEATWSVRSCCLQGHCQVNLSRHRDAVDSYQTCLLADPGNEEARVALAACFKALGDERGLLDTLEMGRRYKQQHGKTQGKPKKRQQDPDDDIWTGSSESEGESEDESDSDSEEVPTEGSLLLSKIRAKRRKRPSRPAKRQPPPTRHEYTQAECQASRQEYTRILLALEVGSGRRELYSDALLAAHQLIQDGLLNNPNIMVTSNKRCKWLLSVLSDQDMALYLHGLTLVEWSVLVCKYVSIMTEHFGQAKQATGLLMRLHDHSMLFKVTSGPQQTALRVAMAECAGRAGEWAVCLTAIRPFVKTTATNNRSFLHWLHGHVIKAGQSGRDCWLSSTPFARFLHRHCKATVDPHWTMLQGHLYAMSGSWEEALRTYLLVPRVGDVRQDAVKSMCLFSAYYHRAQQRTCRTQRWYFLRALAHLDAIGDGVDKATLLYNKGRCLHGMGVLDGAVRFYMAALECDGGDEAVKRAAEYNLSILRY